jgi:ubiquinone/menaquinone biosynthesis C-methylase UbiE
MATHIDPDVYRYYQQAAGGYAETIEPAFRPLAAALVAFARPAADEITIDLGTGSGLAARIAAQAGARVFACDFSARMARVAVQQGTPGVFQGDMHRLALPGFAFDLALAAFSFNSTDPAASFAEALRVLKPGGRLALQEWGTADPLAEHLSDTLAEYAVEDPPPDLVALRSCTSACYPWDAMESLEDIVAALARAGFEDITAKATTVTAVLDSADAFIRYKLAWPERSAEVQALSPEVQRLLLADLRETLANLGGDRRGFVWEPNVVQVTAFRPRG